MVIWRLQTPLPLSEDQVSTDDFAETNNWGRIDSNGTRAESAGTRAVHRIATGLLMMAMVYRLSFTVRPNALSGRDTRVHFDAIVGAAVLCMGLWIWSRPLVPGQAGRVVRVGAADFIIASLSGLVWLLQADYLKAWQLK